ncbi:pyridoxamine 5'-phosphate oxidase family protein [Streptomyces tsukubensis]|uniref:Pyridoxamine 5'-phosphate oxidase n=1 Tax=Streptomyces tsukubensis TaxID=83656 RepID=A0A1V4A3X4_9ACTN|nr:pyridoxamine 5'-phosphate oxidase family protein [Streptomyces tsukubensis]OON74244.1 pyridoxamine 5'-phosphate oxidase [Streptomyces tsukubensis]QFR95311.1 pyridoxamine 5'-phosphate oxidase family protein [Streptomyces tsukubensis]
MPAPTRPSPSTSTSSSPSAWSGFAAAEPGFARIAEDRFRRFVHHTLATLRADGSPRTSGIEVRFQRGEVWLGMMAGSLKALDLRRDPRFSLQANLGPGTEMDGGDVRISGRAVEVTDPAEVAIYVEATKPPEPFHLFRTELTEVVRTHVEGAFLYVQVWNPGSPARTLKRS